MLPHALGPATDHHTPTQSHVDVCRVAHFTDTYLPRRDGVITSLHTLQAALATGGCASLTVAPHHPDVPARADLLTVRSIPSGLANLRLAMWPTVKQVTRVFAWRPDLIHVHTPGPVGLLGVFAAARLGLPVVHTYHTDLHSYADAYRLPPVALNIVLALYARRLGTTGRHRPTTTSTRSQRHSVLDAANRLLLGDADAVVLPTAAVLGRVNLPVAPERIYLVPAAVPQPVLPPGAASEFRARHGIATSDKVVLFVGRVNREKGIELLLPAFAGVRTQFPAARLVLVGAVYEQRWLEKLIAHHGLADAVVLTGQLPPQEVAAAYAGADVFAFASRTDTQGLVLQEAALAGVPSVLADPGLHRTGALGETNVLAEATVHGFGDAISGLLADPVAARRIGNLTRERALGHTPERYRAAIQQVYTAAAARHLSPKDR